MSKFWAKVDKSGGPDACWPWLGCTRRRGYGYFKRAGKGASAHRVAYELAYGDPGELHVLHRCDNPPCCNPAHLFAGSNADNMADKALKGRAPSTAIRGERNPNAKLTDRQVALIRAMGVVPDAALAMLFGVARATVYRAKRRLG